PAKSETLRGGQEEDAEPWKRAVAHGGVPGCPQAGRVGGAGASSPCPRGPAERGGALAGPRNGTTKRRNDMIYKDFQGLKLSALGMGCMRLPRNSASDADVNEAETARMVACAMERGVNYYDTAWGYHEGNSETVMGRVLAKYPRESFYLATKFPGYDLANMPKVKEIFPRQLEKCGVDYFDFYLIHNVCEMNIDAYLDPQYGIMDYLLEQKAQGRIRHLGFSAHGSYEVMKRFLDAYADNMESCQLQLHAAD